MQERTFNLAIAGFPYGGNGGMSNEYPGVRNFLVEVAQKAKADPRIEKIFQADFSDTPITMTRNRSVAWARQCGADFLLMIDSDMQPDCELSSDPTAKPFWDSSLDFLVTNYDKGPNVVCAPYCGPPPMSNVYVFYWEQPENDCPNAQWSIEQYSREHAANMRGIQPCAAQPTGLILFDMRAFDLTDPGPFYQRLRHEGATIDEARRQVHPWFYYEYKDIYETEKCSTEDVTATRDMSFHGHLETGRDVIYCNWDAWAGHVKPKVVRKPNPVDAGSIHAQFRHAVEMKQSSNAQMFYIGAADETPENAVYVPYEDSLSVSEGTFRVGDFTTPQNDLDGLGQLVRSVNPAIVVEVGSWVGESSRAIAQNLFQDGAELYCVDHFEGTPDDHTGQLSGKHGKETVKQAFLENTKPFSNIHLWEMSSAEAAQKWRADGKFAISLLYLDADHSEAALTQQIREWLPLMAQDDSGVFAGHDYGDPKFGVTQAVHKSFKKVNHVPGTNLWWARVRDFKAENPESNGRHGGEGDSQPEGGQGPCQLTGHRGTL